MNGKSEDKTDKYGKSTTDFNSNIGFVFDLDGTLINSTDIGDVIMKELKDTFNLHVHDKKQKEIDELIYEIFKGENEKGIGINIIWLIFKKRKEFL